VYWIGHRRWRKAIDAYVDGELDPDVRAQVAAHVRRCWWCSEDVELTGMIKASLRQRRRVIPLSVARLRRFATRVSEAP
jgi:anti-sigma factor RsiW